VDNAINSAEVEASFEQEAINLRAAQGLPHTSQYVDHFHDPNVGPFIVTTPACESSVERFLEKQERGETDSLTYRATVIFIYQLCLAVHSLHKVHTSLLKGGTTQHRSRTEVDEPSCVRSPCFTRTSPPGTCLSSTNDRASG
jgi:hypothetical protein